MSAIQQSLLVFKSTGNLWGTGSNTSGQLGNGNTTSVSSPISISPQKNWAQVACGYGHTMGVKTEGTWGTLWGVGSNTFGQLGRGNIISYSSPIQVGTLTDWAQVSCGRIHTVAIKSDGTLWGIGGYNPHGQLGNGTTAYYSSPIQVGSLTTWKQVAAGDYHTVAVDTLIKLWAFGYNTYGQLGNGNTISYSSPIQVGSLTDWAQVSGGYEHTMAVKTDGTLWGFGFNAYGQLGNGSRNHYSSPIQIGTLTNWSQVACGSNHTLATKTDGTLWSCGYNSQGQLGNGTITNYSSPIQVGSLTNWLQVSGGYEHTIAVKTDSRLLAGSVGASGGTVVSSTTSVSGSISITTITYSDAYTATVVRTAYTDGSVSVVSTDAFGGSTTQTLVNTNSLYPNNTLWSWGSNTQGQLGNGTNVYYSSPIQVGSLTNWSQVACGNSHTVGTTTS